MKELYHGSIYDFNEINVAKGKGYKDFGKGFYATAVARHAENIARRNKQIYEKRRQAIRKGRPELKSEQIIAYRYNLLYDQEAVGLTVKIFENADIEWAKFILQNRRSPVSVHDYDIVIGPTADEQTALILNQYEEDLKNSNYDERILRQMIAELKPENLPKQYFFGTERALKTLRFGKVRRQIIG